jgi:hypothetical protein
VQAFVSANGAASLPAWGSALGRYGTKNVLALKARLIYALESRFQRLDVGLIRIPGAVLQAECEETADGAKHVYGQRPRLQHGAAHYDQSDAEIND